MYSFMQNYYFFSTNTNTTSAAANQKQSTPRYILFEKGDFVKTLEILNSILVICTVTYITKTV